MKNADRRTLGDSFRSEHQKLREKVDECRKWANELTELGLSRFGEMRDRLQMILHCLEIHFQREKESGLFREISEIEPAQAETAEQLLSDHHILLDELILLCARLDAAEIEFASWQEAQRAFRGFLERLDSHESRELQLLTLWVELTSELK